MLASDGFFLREKSHIQHPDGVTVAIETNILVARCGKEHITQGDLGQGIDLDLK